MAPAWTQSILGRNMHLIHDFCLSQGSLLIILDFSICSLPDQVYAYQVQVLHSSVALTLSVQECNPGNTKR